MCPDKFSFFKISVFLAVFLLCSFGFAQQDNVGSKSSTSSRAADQSLVVRGKYLVENVAVCSQCHTPRDSQGRLERSRWLQGGSLWIMPAQPTENWPQQTPRIAGTPPGTDAQMTMLLTTGIWIDGKQLRPPMPQFRLSVEDAQAVVAYLKTLTSDH